MPSNACSSIKVAAAIIGSPPAPQLDAVGRDAESGARQRLLRRDRVGVLAAQEQGKLASVDHRVVGVAVVYASGERCADQRNTRSVSSVRRILSGHGEWLADAGSICHGVCGAFSPVSMLAVSVRGAGRSLRLGSCDGRDGRGMNRDPAPDQSFHLSILWGRNATVIWSGRASALCPREGCT
jgi:hypothetical protein